MKTILLTGSTGFIGSYLIQAPSKYSFIPFSFQCGIIDDIHFDKIDVVVHLAALVHQMGGASQEAYFHVNTKKTLELAKKAKKSGVNHFIFLSTVKVYGEENNLPYTENSPYHPQDDYAKSKLAAEKVLRSLEDESFIVSIIRTPVVYGEGVKGNIKSLIKLIQNAPLLPITTTNNQRSMVYVGNLCAMINTVIAQQISGIFLASDDQNISTTQLIETIANQMDKKIMLVYIPGFSLLLRVFKPIIYKRLYKNLTVDNNITKKTLSFSNPYTFIQGIHQTILGHKYD